jgi:hypothetical protein
MAQVAQTYQDQLDRIKKCVQGSYEYFKDNYDRYHRCRKFLFETAITDEDEDVLTQLGKPIIECNTLEAFVSRLIGEFSKQVPSISAESAPSMQQNMQPGMMSMQVAQAQFVEDYIRSLLFYANNDGFENECMLDLYSGGYSVMKAWTEYENEYSFEQIFKVGRPNDVTLCGFDPLARKPNKTDARYWFEIFPKSEEDFKQENPGINIENLKFIRSIKGFNWSYQNKNEKILLICDYYEKKKKKKKLVKLSTGETVLADEAKQRIEKWEMAIAAGIELRQPPAIVQERMTDITTICRYRFIEDQVIEYVETDYKLPNYIFVKGKSVLLKNGESGAVKEMTIPYIYQAMGNQRLQNFAFQSLANELENMVQNKWIIAKPSLDPNYSDSYTNNQVPNVMIYNPYMEKNGEMVPLPPPQPVVRAPIPPEITNTISMCNQMNQMILGSFDAALGINNNQLSGIAIQEGATQSNASAEPYITGFLEGLNGLAQFIADVIPKYIKTPRTLPTVSADGKRGFTTVNVPGGTQINYDSNSLNVRVEAGVNFAVQKTKALQAVTALSQSMPIFGQFMNAKGLKQLIRNLDIEGRDQLEVLADEFMKEMEAEKKNQPPNPAMIKLQQDQQKMAQTIQQNQVENSLRAGEIANDSEANQIKKMQVILQAQQEDADIRAQMQKTNAENIKSAVDISLKAGDQQHRHTKEAIELAHKISTTDQPTTINQSTEETQNG